MHFSPAIVSALLAFSTFAVAAPAPSADPAPAPSGETKPADSPKPDDKKPQPAPTTTPTPSPSGLSVVQQLMLAPLATDRFDILKENKDFVFNLNPEPIPDGKGGNLKAANRKTFPALVGAGAGMAVGIIKPCGLNTFHVHPRSSELQIVIQGSLITEMVPENGVLDKDGKRRVIRNELKKFDMTPFYQGSVHHQYNPNCEDAVFVASFASEDFGAGQVVEEVFSMDKAAIIDTFGATLSGDQISKIKEKLPPSVVQGVEVCMKKCNPKKGN